MNFLLLVLFSEINIDIGRFKANGDLTLCELYISLPYSELSYKKEGDVLKSNFQMRLTINTPESQEVVRDFNKISYINSYEEAESRKLRILDEIELVLEPGKYEMKVEIISDSSIKSVEKGVEIEPPQTELYLSDIELATSIEPATENNSSDLSEVGAVPIYRNKFVKNGLKIIPNPQSIFGEKYPTLYAYTEIYNLKPGTNLDSSFRGSRVLKGEGVSTLPLKYEVNYTIFNEAGDSLYTLPLKTLSAISKDITEMGGIDIGAFKEGTYILQVKVTQKVGGPMAIGMVAQKEKKFWVVKETKDVGTVSTVQDFTAEELDYYHLINYIAPRSEFEFYKTLSDEAKHKYLVSFWKRAGRPLLHTLIERVKYADANFLSIAKQGRDSDRGKICIRYGKPDEVEKFSFDRTYHSCEKWTYFGRGGMTFVFVDKADDGRYELMYSNIPDEPTAPDYRGWVNPEALP